MRALGEQLAASLRPGDVLVLAGDLGAGKTTLTQGIARGVGVRQPITSPTFVIAKTYPTPTGRFVHVDAYRLTSFGELDELVDEVFAPDTITVIEWGDAVRDALPDAFEIRITRSDEGRDLEIDARLEARA